ncbi:MAG: hypothetical protein N2053_01030 [Chitinispirillaceae bacterium]|nr:hypothetical protein [Chitinispirillaceae bacterium]
MKIFKGVIIIVLIIIIFREYIFAENIKRERGEDFYFCKNSNAEGAGNIWLSLRSVTHVWDNTHTSIDTTSLLSPVKNSNLRIFPEIYLTSGILEIISLQVSGRPLGYGFRPAWFSCGLKFTTPDNYDLRFLGGGFSVDYTYQMRETTPTIGGYTGFMPEGFVVKGSNIEARFIYEVDFLPTTSFLPMRIITNVGLRMPLSKRRELFQMLSGICLVYSGYDFDFFTQYWLESFNNMVEPLAIQDGSKRFLLWFSENPMYLTFGGNLRYRSGIKLSLSIPILLSYNQGSKISFQDLVELHRNTDSTLYTYEKRMGIKDPFDPWFVRWKIVFGVTFPLKFKMTGAEMRRNYLLLRIYNKEKKIELEKKLE